MTISRRRFLSWLVPLAVVPVVGPHMLLSDRPRTYALGEIQEAVWALGWYGDASGYHTTVSTWGRRRGEECVAMYPCRFVTSNVEEYRREFDRNVRPYLRVHN